jgi:Flp pilus assembly protein TadG
MNQLQHHILCFIQRRRRGGILIYVMISMVSLIGICSLAVDFGRVEVAKTELERAGDAAARAGTLDLPLNPSRASADAITYAAYNTVDGTPLVLLAGDVLVVKWQIATDTIDTTSNYPNAVQVTSHRDSTRGNPIPCIMGQPIGIANCNLTFTCIAQVGATCSYAVFGMSSLKSSASVDSYQSASADYPVSGPMPVRRNGNVGSNGSSTFTGGTVYGDNGYATSTSGYSGTGSSAKIPLTQVYPNPSVGTYNNSVLTESGWYDSSTRNMTVPSGQSFAAPAGSYYLNDFSIGNGTTISFSGATILYVSGNMSYSGVTFSTYQNKPANLKIIGVPQTAGKTVNISNGSRLYAMLYAPQDNVTLAGSELCGSVIGNVLVLNCIVHVDESLGINGGYFSPTISLIR